MVIVVVVVVMLVSMFAAEFAATLVATMNPVIVLAMARDPDPFVPIIPIAGTFVIRSIANIDVKADCSGARFNQHACREQNAQYY
ncbi:MAG: hypothetical protein JO201_03670 [Verrucomicrobia bacterium]|nr:hypothetical protein [Verrucomicrobiota bacterium]